MHGSLSFKLVLLLLPDFFHQLACKSLPGFNIIFPEKVNHITIFTNQTPCIFVEVDPLNIYFMI